MSELSCDTLFIGRNVRRTIRASTIWQLGHFPIQSSLTSEACDTRQGARHGCPTSGYVQDTLGLRLGQNKISHCRLPS